MELDPALMSEQLKKDIEIVRGMVENWSPTYGLGNLTVEWVHSRFSKSHGPEQLSHLERIFFEEMALKSAAAT